MHAANLLGKSTWPAKTHPEVGNFFVNAKRPDEIKRALIAYEKSDAAYTKLLGASDA